jgi:hypothetical protein
MAQKIIGLGHAVSLTTNFSLPRETLQRFLDAAKGRICFFEISVHLSQIESLDEFHEKLAWFKKQSGLEWGRLQTNCVLMEQNFQSVRELKSALAAIGSKLNVQRIFDNSGYCKYSDKTEKWLADEKCVDIPLSLISRSDMFDVRGRACRTGCKFFKILIDGRVTRCFTSQLKGYDQLGDLSKSADVRILPDYFPCLSLNKECRCYLGFKRQIDRTVNYGEY